MRSLAVLAAVFLPASFAFAHGLDDHVPDAHQIAQLEAKAAAASPEQQTYLYAEIVHSMTEMATAEYQAGNEKQASQSLENAQGYASKIQMNLLHDAHKLKKAEILIRHTAFRLHELLVGASLDARPALEATISQLNKIQSEMLSQVFHH